MLPTPAGQPSPISPHNQPTRALRPGQPSKWRRSRTARTGAKWPRGPRGTASGREPDPALPPPSPRRPEACRDPQPASPSPRPTPPCTRLTPGRALPARGPRVRASPAGSSPERYATWPPTQPSTKNEARVPLRPRSGSSPACTTSRRPAPPPYLPPRTLCRERRSEGALAAFIRTLRGGNEAGPTPLSARRGAELVSCPFAPGRGAVGGRAVADVCSAECGEGAAPRHRGQEEGGSSRRRCLPSPGCSPRAVCSPGGVSGRLPRAWLRALRAGGGERPGGGRPLLLGFRALRGRREGRSARAWLLVPALLGRSAPQGFCVKRSAGE